MKTNLKCLDCSLSNFIDLMYEFEPNEAVREANTREYLKFLSTIEYTVTPPEIARTAHSKIKELIGNNDPYREKKKLYNTKMLEKYDFFKTTVQNSGNPVYTAVQLAIGGNIIDFTPKNKGDIDDSIEKILHTDLTINDVDKMIEDLKNASLLLYLTDNTGEIVLDKLLIETLTENGIIDKEKVVAATRGYPIINDATFEDARETGLTDVVHVIGNGDYTPGTLLETSSEEFREVYRKADVVISKGQGNFETLEHKKDKNIYFLLIAKCEVIAKKIQVDVGSFICKKSI